MKINNIKIGIIGLGYVGLPLAVEFGKKFKTIGYDLKKSRVLSLKLGKDETKEVTSKDLKKSKLLKITNNSYDLTDCNFYIVTVPTPIFQNKKPDLSYIKKASVLVGKMLKKNDHVVFESTVYPGATEEICLPILKKYSNLKFNKEFFIGYSPERINPGDKFHKITDIKKITSGSTNNAAKYIDQVYGSIIKVGTYKANNIKVAEAAKVIENTQRDLNIALINELAIVFDKMNIDTENILNAAGTKWNFLPFRPGLVGGHCIGVDPYYLTYKSIKMGYTPKIILSGRYLNDGMTNFLTKKLVSHMKKRNIEIKKSKILIMGLTFKENCPDTRNSKVFDLIKKLKKEKANVSIFDPWVNEDVNNDLNKIDFIRKPKLNYYDCVVVSVAHDIFKKLGIKKIQKFTKKNNIIFDLKYSFKEKKPNLIRF